VTTREQGMGFGLSISRSIIEAHGGRIWAENNSSSGATIRFTVPALQAEEPGASPGAAR
jgi:two-component system sensor kinase FixL